MGVVWWKLKSGDCCRCMLLKDLGISTPWPIKDLTCSLFLPLSVPWERTRPRLLAWEQRGSHWNKVNLWTARNGNGWFAQLQSKDDSHILFSSCLTKRKQTDHRGTHARRLIRVHTGEPGSPERHEVHCGSISLSLSKHKVPKNYLCSTVYTIMHFKFWHLQTWLHKFQNQREHFVSVQKRFK